MKILMGIISLDQIASMTRRGEHDMSWVEMCDGFDLIFPIVVS